MRMSVIVAIIIVAAVVILALLGLIHFSIGFGIGK